MWAVSLVGVAFWLEGNLFILLKHKVCLQPLLVTRLLLHTGLQKKMSSTQDSSIRRWASFNRLQRGEACIRWQDPPQLEQIRVPGTRRRATLKCQLQVAALQPWCSIQGQTVGPACQKIRQPITPRLHGEVRAVCPTTLPLASNGQHAGQLRCRTMAVTAAQAVLLRESGWAGGRERHAAWQHTASWQLNTRMNMTSTCQRASCLAMGHKGTGTHPLGLDRVPFKGRGFGLAAVASIRGGWSSPCKGAPWPPLRCILLAGQGDHMRRHHVADTCSQAPLRPGPSARS